MLFRWACAALVLVGVYGTSMAVCVGGELRSVLDLAQRSTYHCHVVASLRRVQVHVDTFLAISGGQASELAGSARQRTYNALRDAYNPVAMRVLENDGWHDPDLSARYTNRCNVSLSGVGFYAGKNRDIFMQYIPLRVCYRMIEMEEKRRGGHYNWIYRVRTDMVHVQDVTEAFPNLMRFNGSRVFTPFGGMSARRGNPLVNDHAFLCPRRVCRPYFEVLELLDSEHCINAGSGNASHGSHGPAGAIESCDGPPTSPFSLPRGEPADYLMLRYFGLNHHRGCAKAGSMMLRYVVPPGGISFRKFCTRRLLQHWSAVESEGNDGPVRLDSNRSAILRVQMPYLRRCDALGVLQDSARRLTGRTPPQDGNQTVKEWHKVLELADETKDRVRDRYSGPNCSGALYPAEATPPQPSRNSLLLDSRLVAHTYRHS